MRDTLSPPVPFQSDHQIRYSFIFSFVIWLLATAYLSLNYTHLPPVVPFFYSLTHGDKQLAQKEFLFVLPLTSLIFCLTHLGLSRFIYSSDRVFSRLLASTSLLVSFLFAVALVHIVLIVL